MDSLPPPDKKKRTEINKRANARRDPAERSPHFSLSIEVKKDQRSRLEAIKQRINNAKSALGIDRSTSSTQNADLMERLLSYFEMIRPSAVERSSSSSTKTNVLQGPTTSPSKPDQQSPSSGEVPVQQRTRKRQIYVESTVDDGCYVCTKSSLQALCKYFTTNPLCEFCGKDYKWCSATFSSQGHVCKIEVPCVCNDSVTWLSSGVLGHPAKYYANVRMVHAFTCTGLTETQYHGFAEAAGIGCVMDKTIDTIYKDQGFGYVSVVQELCNKTMADARAEVQATPDYITSGDCIITDARHDSSRSAMHSTVTAISMSNKKIISVCNWSRADERSAPSREVPMTQQLVTNLTEAEGA